MELEYSYVPPGFRFHPTEEELVGYYLKRKVNSLKIDLDVIIDIDLYRIEPWDIQDRCKFGYEEQNEWYFFSHKDRKYPTGTRTNRATTSGFWKATGRDKAVISKEQIIGMRKTLVFYKGRAPNGRKTDWLMHEYRLQTCENGPPQEEGWVVCRAFKKPSPSQKQGYHSWDNAYCGSNHWHTPSYPDTPDNIIRSFDLGTVFSPIPSETTLSSYTGNQMVELPKLDSPSISTSFTMIDNNFEHAAVANEEITGSDDKSSFLNQYSEWKSLDKLFGCEVIGASSYPFTNMPLVPHSDDIDAQSHLSQVLDQCFPEL